MPQRKEYEVYSGNQKVGESRKYYSDKTPSEAEMNIRIAAANMVLKELKSQDAIDNNPKLYQKKKTKK